ncbi:MAG: hypothetical protein R3F59_24455 [Myxococcota bacterium]
MALAVAGAALGGCVYDEGLEIANLRGRVIVPEEAVTRTLVLGDGTEQTITDIKLLGPVYLGLFPSVEPANVLERYPHPEIGPQFREDVPGDTYPYGGTTVGDLRFACFEFLRCKVVSGRFLDYQEIVEWFRYIEQPILDASGAEVNSGEFLAQACYDLLNVNTDDEVRITAYEDRNGDDVIDDKDLDFVYDEAEHAYVGDFEIYQQEMFWDQSAEGCEPGRDCPGFSLWGWMDAPSKSSFQYSTCNPTLGYRNQEYNANFTGGAAFPTLLNFPSTYITNDDWVASEPYQWNDKYAEPDIYLDFAVQ